MKKLILISTLLTVTSTPLIALVGCGEITYTVTDKEFIDAIMFKGENYLQVKQTSSSRQSEDRAGIIVNAALSPKIYNVTVDGEMYQKKEYTIIENWYRYYKYERKEDGSWDEPVEVSSSEFISVNLAGSMMFYIYDSIQSTTGPFQFDNINKCYSAEVTEEQLKTKYNFYFENKKLTKMEMIVISTSSTGEDNCVEFSYKKYTPPMPQK